jgi:predicted DNA-binding transcriptional regulator AlpA
MTGLLRRLGRRETVIRSPLQLSAHAPTLTQLNHAQRVHGVPRRGFAWVALNERILMTTGTSTVAITMPAMGRLLTSAEAAQACGVTKSTMAQWRLLSIGPDFLRLSGTNIRYPETAVLAWLEQRLVKASANAEEPARAIAREKKAAWRAKQPAKAGATTQQR